MDPPTPQPSSAGASTKRKSPGEGSPAEGPTEGPALKKKKRNNQDSEKELPRASLCARRGLSLSNLAMPPPPIFTSPKTQDRNFSSIEPPPSPQLTVQQQQQHTNSSRVMPPPSPRVTRQQEPSCSPMVPPSPRFTHPPQQYLYSAPHSTLIPPPPSPKVTSHQVVPQNQVQSTPPALMPSPPSRVTGRQQQQQQQNQVCSTASMPPPPPPPPRIMSHQQQEQRNQVCSTPSMPPPSPKVINHHGQQGISMLTMPLYPLPHAMSPQQQATYSTHPPPSASLRSPLEQNQQQYQENSSAMMLSSFPQLVIQQQRGQPCASLTTPTPFQQLMIHRLQRQAHAPSRMLLPPPPPPQAGNQYNGYLFPTSMTPQSRIMSNQMNNQHTTPKPLQINHQLHRQQTTHKSPQVNNQQTSPETQKPPQPMPQRGYTQQQSPLSPNRIIYRLAPEVPPAPPPTKQWMQAYVRLPPFGSGMSNRMDWMINEMTKEQRERKMGMNRK